LKLGSGIVPFFFLIPKTKKINITKLIR